MKQRRYSKQRDLIYQALRERSDHPTAELLYQTLKPDEPALSLGTVYRNLNQLAEDGLALRMAFPVDRYDANTTEHLHFYCTSCRRLYDLDLPADETLDRMVEAQGYRVERHDLIVRGLCPGCRERSDADE